MGEKGYWSSDWMELQMQYWKEWLEIAQHAAGNGKLPQNPWEKAQEHWWQAVSPAAPPESRVFMEKMMEQGKSLFRLAGMFSGGESSEDWHQALDRIREGLTTAQAGSEGAEGYAKGAAQRLMGFWEAPLGNWQRLVSALSLIPNGMAGGLPGDGRQADLEGLFSVPGLGYTREEQAQYQKLIRCILAYRQVEAEYAGFFANVGVLSVERMRQVIETRSREGASIKSARSFYDLWVATCEEVYTERVMTPEYAKINGRLVNALVAVRHQQGEMIDEKLSALHMPTRRELRTLQTRMQENRRENRKLQAEVETLRQQMAELARPIAPAVKKSRRKTAVRKKTARPKK